MKIRKAKFKGWSYCSDYVSVYSLDENNPVCKINSGNPNLDQQYTQFIRFAPLMFNTLKMVEKELDRQPDEVLSLLGEDLVRAVKSAINMSVNKEEN